MRSVNKILSLPKQLALVSSCLLTCIILFFQHASGQSPAEVYNQAATHYQSKEYREAAEEYKSLLAQGYNEENVLYNLANCYYKMDSIGKSILSYERALKLDPKDEDATYNLKLAQLKLADRIQPVPELSVITWWNDFISSNSSGGWAMYALITLWLALVIVAVYLFIARRRVLNALASIFFLLSIVLLSLAIHNHKMETSSGYAIVITPASFVKSAPDAGSSDLFMIHEGSRITLLDNVGDWVKVRFEDGKIGWMEKGTFEVI